MVPYMTPLMADHCLQEIGLDNKADFDIENDTQVSQIVDAALLCKNMVNELEDMEVVPGYIIYEEYEEIPTEDLLTKDKDKTPDSKTESNQTKTEEIKADTTKEESKEETKEEVKQTQNKDGKNDNEDNEGKSEGENEEEDGEPAIDPEQLFKGKRVKEFI